MNKWPPSDQPFLRRSDNLPLSLYPDPRSEREIAGMKGFFAIEMIAERGVNQNASGNVSAEEENGGERVDDTEGSGGDTMDIERQGRFERIPDRREDENDQAVSR